MYKDFYYDVIFNSALLWALGCTFVILLRYKKKSDICYFTSKLVLHASTIIPLFLAFVIFACVFWFAHDVQKISTPVELIAFPLTLSTNFAVFSFFVSGLLFLMCSIIQLNKLIKSRDLIRSEKEQLNRAIKDKNAMLSKRKNKIDYLKDKESAYEETYKTIITSEDLPLKFRNHISQIFSEKEKQLKMSKREI